jgi:hypothetical protein
MMNYVKGILDIFWIFEAMVKTLVSHWLACVVGKTIVSAWHKCVVLKR